MQSKATNVADYLKDLPPERREALQAIRAVILKNLDPDIEEGMQYGHIGYYVPHRVFPAGYHCDPKQPLPYAALASQKNHMALYLMCVYTGLPDGNGEPAALDWFRQAWLKAGKKLDMGASCVRFKRLDEVPLEVVAQLFRRIGAKKYIAAYEAVLATQRKKGAVGKPAADKAGGKKAAAATVPAKKTAVKKAPAGKPAAKAPAASKPAPRKPAASTAPHKTGRK
ncbi:MAG TPA: DUF1801 domain-containing protein [Usitatibacteraceae bacterium]|nr:DUF1801 domain-containing protein [Usitatibacteraceae bacterium]